MSLLSASCCIAAVNSLISFGHNWERGRQTERGGSNSNIKILSDKKYAPALTGEVASYLKVFFQGLILVMT